MSGLLRRLAGEALRGPATSGAIAGRSRIRPAAGIHAQVPLASSASEPAPTQVAADPPSTDASQATPITPVAILPQERFGETAASAGAPLAAAVIGATLARERAAAIRTTEPGTPRAVDERVEPQVPPTLLGEVAAAPPAHGAVLPLASPRVAYESPAQRAAAEPTEVHVHIGRIDVIAPPVPAKAERKARAPRRETLPLSEYLARRRTS